MVYPPLLEDTLEPPAKVGLALARADLGYIRAVIETTQAERALTFLPYAVLVAFEAHAFCTQQLGIRLPILAWNDELAAAVRTNNKLFDDSRRDLKALSRDIVLVAAETRAAFRGGWKRQLARALHIWNPDLSVLMLHDVPVSTNVSMGFHAAIQVPGPRNQEAAGRVVHDLAYGVGQMIAALGLAEQQHRAIALADMDWIWGDGDSVVCYAEMFAGEIPDGSVPLLVLLQGASATAHFLADADCCNDCWLAAFKHRLVAAHHIARSLTIVRPTLATSALTRRIDWLLDHEDVRTVQELRALRNGLVHLGLSDAPLTLFAATDPATAVIEHYAQRSIGTANKQIKRALEHMQGRLTEWMLQSPPGGTGLLALLRPPFE
jgi:hypothetical protein